ncbi:putative Mg(2+) transport ATPase [Anaerotignum neopropionicum]|uniref:Putative Mg(2+) transport ATPase n=1 Tax=Anaerotignum neopropionicum TaxID=36847 RepID=A0A136WGD1_9FIRM|nr:MgtC/SapB family protein [Anaerotignum neopropionicum]KXL53419.1 putative Mg(2+) transport ATPase [Anaerotignum neopropionicum]
MILKQFFLEESLLGLHGNAEFIFRIIIACICGGIVGYERTRRRKEAGIRTHVIVAIGSTLMMIVSKYGFYDVITTAGIGVDVSRIASNVITGISFLGAGVIFVKNISIKGLTTAAGLWATAGIGLAIGAGMYSIGIFTTIFIPIIQILLHSGLNKQEFNHDDTVLITFYHIPSQIDSIKKELNKRNIEILHMELEKNPDGTATVILDVTRDTMVTCTDLTDFLAENPLVKSFKI